MPAGHTRPAAPRRFGDFTFDARSLELRRAGRVVPLRPKAARALAMLIARHPRLVDREDLRRELWAARAVEWEAGLNQIMRQLRRALGDDPRAPVFIETVPRQGYRFIGEVVSPRPGRARLRRFRRDAVAWLVGGLSLPAVVIALCVMLGRA